MANKVELNESVAWDLIKSKQTLDAVKRWVNDNNVALKTLNLLPGIAKILWPVDPEDM